MARAYRLFQAWEKGYKRFDLALAFERRISKEPRQNKIYSFWCKATVAPCRVGGCVVCAAEWQEQERQRLECGE